MFCLIPLQALKHFEVLLAGAQMSRRYLGGFIHQQEHDPSMVRGMPKSLQVSQPFQLPSNCKITNFPVLPHLNILKLKTISYKTDRVAQGPFRNFPAKSMVNFG